MTNSEDFGAYIPRHLLDEMSHAEAYITARVVFWLKERDQVYRTDGDLMEECAVSRSSLQRWKALIKAKHPYGLNWKVRRNAFGKTTFYYFKEEQGGDCVNLTQRLSQFDTTVSSKRINGCLNLTQRSSQFEPFTYNKNTNKETNISPQTPHRGAVDKRRTREKEKEGDPLAEFLSPESLQAYRRGNPWV